MWFYWFRGSRLIPTYLPLGHQFSLRCRSSFDQGAGGGGDGLGRLEDLLLKVQALVSLLFTREEKQQPINTPLLRLLKQKNKKQRGLLRRQDKHVVQKYFETEECWNANWERGVGGLCCEDDSCGADEQHDRSRWPCREVNRLSVNAGGASNLGLGPWPQLLQFLGSRFNGGRRSQQLVLRNDRGVLGVDPLRACSTRHTVLATLLPVGGGAG